MLWIPWFGRIFCAEPVPTSAENALARHHCSMDIRRGTGFIALILVRRSEIGKPGLF
jgi:hypothetical protein